MFTPCLRAQSDLRQIRLERAVEGPRFHVFGNKSLFTEDVQTESLSGRTQVLMELFVHL